MLVVIRILHKIMFSVIYNTGQLALTFWRRTFFFQILAHPVFKM